MLEPALLLLLLLAVTGVLRLPAYSAGLSFPENTGPKEPVSGHLVLGKDGGMSHPEPVSNQVETGAGEDHC